MRIRENSIKAIFCLVLLLIFSVGCSIHLVSDYDANMDKGVTEVQTQVEGIFGKLVDCVDPSTKVCPNPSSTYSADDYKKIRDEVNVLIVRSESVSHNEPTTNMLYLLADSLYENAPVPPSDSGGGKPAVAVTPLQTWQKGTSAITIDDIRNTRQLVEVQFKSILTLELAKKSGDSSTSTTATK
ncbi:hypothetical protein [Burkholderia pyrrocinia]